MAILGASSNWDGVEKKDDFLNYDNFIIGWDYNHAKDLYDAVSLLKTGDIVYLKDNQISSRTVIVKCICIITQSFVHCLIENGLTKETITYWNRLYIKKRWVVKNEFHINITIPEGELTNVRSAIFYEKYLPFVQKKIIEKFLNQS